jgi:hypothetical protein
MTLKMSASLNNPVLCWAIVRLARNETRAEDRADCESSSGC